MTKNVIFSIILAVLLTIFAIQNAQAVIVSMFNFNLQISLALMIIVVFLLGGVSGYLMKVYFDYRKKRIIKQNSNISKEVEMPKKNL